jgi:hypothetical protein
LGKKLKHLDLMMVGSTHQTTSRDFVKFTKFCSNIVHHIPQNKIVPLSTKIEPWLNLHITCSNMQICQIHLCGLVVTTTCYLQNISRISITISPPTLMFSSSRSLVIQRFAEDLTIDPILLQVVTLELKTSHKSTRTSEYGRIPNLKIKIVLLMPSCHML